MDAAAVVQPESDIIITHFINPHQFWYKIETVSVNKILYDLEVKLQKYILNNQHDLSFNKPYFPKMNEVIAVLSENRWLRAIVNEINNDNFTLWAIDYGKPLYSKAKFIRFIPDDFVNLEIESVFFGGLKNILPFEKTFDLITNSIKLVVINKWSEKAIKLCENIIHQPFNTYNFKIEHTHNKQNFGDLTITTDSKATYNIKDILIDVNEGTEYIDNFYQKLNEFKLNESPSWHQFKDNQNLLEINPISLQHKPLIINKSDNNNVNQVTINKVKNWQEKNETCVTNNPINDNIMDNSINSLTDDLQILTNKNLENISNIVLESPIDKNIVDNVNKSVSTKPHIVPASDDDARSVSSAVTEDSSTKSKRLAAMKKRFQSAKKYNLPSGCESNIPSYITNENKKLLSVDPIINQKDLYKFPTLSNESNVSASNLARPYSNTAKSSESQVFSNLSNLNMNYIRSKNNKQRIKVDNSLHPVNEVCLLKSSMAIDTVLVHGTIPIPIDKITEANFTSEIQEQMDRLRINNIYRIQQYALPHLGRLNSLILVNGPQTGKTYSYLPMICSLINIFKHNEQIVEGVGPVALIIVPLRSEAQNLYLRCRQLTDKNVICTGERNKTRAMGELQSNTDLLITTPEGINLLKESSIKCFDPKRLKHLIIENLNLWKSENHKILTDVIKKFHTNVQIVVTSQIWVPYIDILLKSKKLSNPLLCIGDAIEAAVYAKINFQLKIIPKKLKLSKIVEFLNKHYYQNEKCIIVCKNDVDVDELAAGLKSCGLFVVSCTKLLTASDIADIKIQWNKKLYDENFVIITTDDCLTQLEIQNAQNLIHFTLSTSWTRTCRRFSVLFNCYTDQVKEVEKQKNLANTLILLDEDNNDQLPKLVKFLERINYNINPQIKQLAERIEIEREKSKLYVNRPLCEKWLEFAKIHDKNKCDKRHLITYEEAPPNDLPHKGYAEIKIISCESPIHFYARILKHKLENDDIWQITRESQEYVKFYMDFTTYYSNTDNHEIYIPVLNDLCVVKDYDRYERGKVIQIEKMKSSDVTKVSVKLIDSGQLNKLKADQLLCLHEKFKIFPSQAIDLYLTNVVPFDEEENWDSNSKNTIINWIEKYNNNASYRFIAYIDFIFSNIVYANEILIQERLPKVNTYNSTLLLKKNAIKKEIIKYVTTATNEIRSLSKELFYKPVTQSESLNLKESLNAENENISNDKISTISDEEVQKLNSVSNIEKPRSRPLLFKSKELIENKQHIQDLNIEQIWEHLNEKEITKILITQFDSPNNFYIQKLQNIEKLQVLNEKINEFIANGSKIVQNPKIGLNYLAKMNKKYHRCKIISVNCDTDGLFVNVFFSDNGKRRIIKLSELKTTNSEIINLLPFQAINCSLIGITSKNINGVWTNEENDEINKILQTGQLYVQPIIKAIQNNDEIFNYCKHQIILIQKLVSEEMQINKQIVKLGYAVKDPETTHYLDLAYKNQCNYSSSDEEEEWEDDPNAKTFDFKNFNKNNTKDDLNNDNSMDIVVNFTEDELLKLLRNGGDNEPSKCTEINTALENIKTENSNNVKINNQLKNIKNTNEEVQVNNNSYTVPNLISIYKIPKVIWQQCDNLIYLKISAPDIQDYYLSVTNSFLKFSTLIGGEMNVLCINFFGCIDETVVSHEIRGLNVIIRLLKKVKGKSFLWPRLTNETDKHNWLKYNFESIIKDEQMDVSVQGELETNCNYASDSESDLNETFDYENLNKNYNPENIFDAFEED